METTTPTSETTVVYRPVEAGASISPVHADLRIARRFLRRAVREKAIRTDLAAAQADAENRLARGEPYEGGVDVDEFRRRYGL